MKPISGAALDDCVMNEAFCERGREQNPDRNPAGRLAEDRHVGRVAAERSNFILHPLQRGNHVVEAEVALGLVALGEHRVGQVAECPEPIVDRDDHHVAARRERCAVVGG